VNGWSRWLFVIPKDEVVAHFQALADKQKCTVTQLALTWLLKQGNDVILIPRNEAYRVSRADMGEHGNQAERRGRKGNSRVCERCGGERNGAAGSVLRLFVWRHGRTADERILHSHGAFISHIAI